MCMQEIHSKNTSGPKSKPNVRDFCHLFVNLGNWGGLLAGQKSIEIHRLIFNSQLAPIWIGEVYLCFSIFQNWTKYSHSSSHWNEINFRNIVFWQIDELWLSWSNLNSCLLAGYCCCCYTLSSSISLFTISDWITCLLIGLELLLQALMFWIFTLLKTIFKMWEAKIFHNHYSSIISTYHYS